MKNNPKRIAVFASGSGSNAENLVRYFLESENAKVELILSNNSQAGVIGRAANFGIPTLVFNRKDFYESDVVLQQLKTSEIDFIILAGFLWLVPENLILAFENKIINIHPALLPAFGGKGLYGNNVHRAVVDSGNVISGITIHYVNTQFDDGEIIFQAACHVSTNETADSLAKKIHELEYAYFPVVVEKILRQHGGNKISVDNSSALNR